MSSPQGAEGEGYAPTRGNYAAGRARSDNPEVCRPYPRGGEAIIEAKSSPQGAEGEGYAPTRGNYAAGRARSDNPEVVEASLSFFAGY